MSINKTIAQRRRQNSGFTLTELVIVIVLIGIISVVIVPLIGNKFGAVSRSTERAYWVQQAEYALFHIRQDLSVSVPNSVFSSEPTGADDQVVEFLSGDIEKSLYAARYRNRNYNPYDRLQPNNDSSFDIFGNFLSVPSYVSIGTQNATAMRADWTDLMASVPFPDSKTVAEVDVASTAYSTGENSSPLTTITLTSNHRFGAHSPYYRAYFFDGPIGYECDTTAGFLYRVSNYTSLVSGTAFSVRSAAATRDRVIENLLSCKFEVIGGTVYSAPSLRVTLEIGQGSESIQLVDTLLLSNAS